jgi:hypothetical protein
LATTVIQNATWNDAFFDLCRNNPCASNAPGQPPMSDANCSSASGVRRAFSCAALLSRQ